MCGHWWSSRALRRLWAALRFDREQRFFHHSSHTRTAHCLLLLTAAPSTTTTTTTTPFSRLPSDDLSWTLFLDELLPSTRPVCTQSRGSAPRVTTRGLPLFTSGTINRGASGRLQEPVYVEDRRSSTTSSGRTVETYERIPHDPQRLHSSSRQHRQRADLRCIWTGLLSRAYPTRHLLARLRAIHTASHARGQGWLSWIETSSARFLLRQPFVPARSRRSPIGSANRRLLEAACF